MVNALQTVHLLIVLIHVNVREDGQDMIVMLWLIYVQLKPVKTTVHVNNYHQLLHSATACQGIKDLTVQKLLTLVI